MEAAGCFEALPPVHQTYHRTTNANNINAYRHAVRSLLIKLYSFCFFHAMSRYFNSVQTFELQKLSELIFCQREEAVTFYGCRTAAVILLSKRGSMYNMQKIYRS
jgi:hypothetical protein